MVRGKEPVVSLKEMTRALLASGLLGLVPAGALNNGPTH